MKRLNHTKHFWYRETKKQPGDRPTAWYFQDIETEHTHMRVVWLHRDSGEGWYYTIQGPSHVARKVSPFVYDTIAEAKAAAIAWWKINKYEHLQLFKD